MIVTKLYSIVKSVEIPAEIVIGLNRFKGVKIRRVKNIKITLSLVIPNIRLCGFHILFDHNIII